MQKTVFVPVFLLHLLLEKLETYIAVFYRDVSSIHFDPTNKAQTMLVNPTTEPKKAKKPRKSK